MGPGARSLPGRSLQRRDFFSSRDHRPAEATGAFFPAFVVLGFGLAVSVAPLTTLVMSAVGQSRAGTASGINNAVARVAGLLAIAALGAVMLSAFSFHLNRSLRNLAIPPVAMHDLQSNEIRLAALAVPLGVDAETAATIRASIERAFVFGFRLIMVICAGLYFARASFAMANDRIAQTAGEAIAGKL